MANIAILGAGGFGIALATLLSQNGNSVSLWSLYEKEVETLGQTRENAKLLPGVTLPDTVEVTNDIDCVRDKDIVLFAVPSFAVRETAQRIQGKMDDLTVLVNVAKGLEAGSLKRLSQIIREELPNPVVILSGPSHAEEVAKNIPTTIVAASEDEESAKFVQEHLMTPTFRIYTNDDVLGVELGGAIKNIIALAAGVCDGLGLGDDTKAALMTRGLTEITRLGVAMGARADTFAGLAGIGDLIVTCTSMHSRNRRAGILIGKGMTGSEAVAEIGMTVEGYISAKSAWQLAHQYNVEMPIIEEVYAVLYGDKKAEDAIKDLMGRPKKDESEHAWLG